MNEQYVKIMVLCDERHITPYKMCKDISLSQGAITDLKNGRKESLSVSNLAKVARYFNVSVEWLNGQEERTTFYKGKEIEKIVPPSLNVSAEDMGELADVWNTLQGRSEMKMLFKSAKYATKEQVESVARMLESFNKE